MKKRNEKQIQIILIVSILFNILFFGYSVKKIHWKYHQYKVKQELELKQYSHISQPDSVKYFISRNEVFTKLPNDTNEIIMLGNSLTHNFEWHEIFKDVNIKNRGINGDITKGLLQRLDEIVESRPQKIFIEIGINDLLQGYSLDSVFLNYQNIVKLIRQKSPNTKIYIQNVLPTSRNINKTERPVIDSVYKLNGKLKNFSSENELTYIDLFSIFNSNGKLNPKYDCGDNLHLSGSGYKEWCILIEDYIYE